MKCVSIALALTALVTGLIAAWYWHRSTKIVPDPGWHMPGQPGGFTRKGYPRVPQPADSDAVDRAWNVATMEAITDASDLSKVAALWTAASAVLSAASCVIGTLAP